MRTHVAFVLHGTRGGTERRRLLTALVEGPLAVDRLAATTGLSPSTVERHLDVLCANGLVDRRPGATASHYGLADAVDAERWE